MISDLVKASIIPGSTVSNGVVAAADNGLGTGPALAFGPNYAGQMNNAQTLAGPEQIGSYGVLSMPNAGAPKFWMAQNAGTGTVALGLHGFNHKVRKLHS